MSQNIVVLTDLNSNGLTRNERWDINVLQWQKFTDEQKWEAYLDQPYKFHYTNILGNEHQTWVSAVPFPQNLRQRIDTSVAETIRYFQTTILHAYERYYADQANDDDSDCTDPDLRGVSNGDVEEDYRMTNDKQSKFLKFIRSLPFCAPLDYGDFVIPTPSGNNKQCCYCPCNKNKFRHFRTQFDVGEGLSWTCNNSFKKNLTALFQHLHSTSIVGSGYSDTKIAHMLTLKFLQVKHNRNR
jgi:hypothetical protein